MSYNDTLGWVPDTVEDIEKFLIDYVNVTLGTDYNETSFKGSALWLTYKPVIEYSRKLELQIVDLLNFIKENISNLEDFNNVTNNYNRLFNKLKTEVKDVSFYHPGKDDEKGSFGIALIYNSEDDEKDENKQTLIANIIANEIGTSNLTIDYTQEDPKKNYSYDCIGLNEVTKQALSFQWRKAEDKPCFLRFQYKTKEGYLRRSDLELKEKLLDNLNNYRFGTTLTPNEYVSLSDFPEFRYTRLSWSFTKDDIDSYSDQDLTPNFFEHLTFQDDDITLIKVS